MTRPRTRHLAAAAYGPSYIAMLQHAVALALLAVLGARLVSNLRFLRWVCRQIAPPAARLPRVSVLIPARNEAATITACATVEAALHQFQQQYLTGLEHAYLAAFAISVAATVLALFLPGWPGRFRRQAPHTPAAAPARSVGSLDVPAPIVGSAREEG